MQTPVPPFDLPPSCCRCCPGRMLGGVLSETALRRYGTPRTFLLSVVSCLTLLGVVGAALSGEAIAGLYGTSLLAGVAFGAHWGLVPAITSDLFGLQYFGSNYTGLQVGRGCRWESVG